jgi:acyl carrier protein
MTTPTADEILEELRPRVAEAAYVDPSRVTPATRFTEDLSIDSLAGLSLLMKLEEDYGIRVKDEEARQLHTVEDAVALIRSKLAAQPAP